MNPAQIRKLVANWPQIYDSAVERLLNSPSAVDRAHLFLGFALDGGYPVLCPRELLFQNGHILGDPGSNKTSVGMSSLITQLIAANNVSVVITDHKGDMATFERARIEAREAGMPFVWFTNRVGWSSHVFNPFNQTYLKRLSITQRAQQLLMALGLEYGDIYGASFFSSITELHLTNIMEKYISQIHSIADLYRYSSDPIAYRGLGPYRDWENSRHLHAVLNRLCRLFPLNATPEDFPNGQGPIEGSIQVEEILTTPCVVYFFLPAIEEGVTTRAISKLFLYSLMTCATLLKYEGRLKGAAVFMDEAHHLVSQNLPTVLALARDLSISCILVHQCLDQLKRGTDVDLSQIILNCTAFKQIFRASDMITRNYLRDSSGEACYHDLSWKQAINDGPEPCNADELDPRRGLPNDPLLGGPQVQVSESYRSRLAPNEIMRISANQYTSFVNFTANTGYSHYNGAWTPIVSGYHITKDEYRDAQFASWPAANRHCVVVPIDSPHRDRQPKATEPASKKPGNSLSDRVQDGWSKFSGPKPPMGSES